jgi:hypothetical protein
MEKSLKIESIINHRIERRDRYYANAHKTNSLKKMNIYLILAQKIDIELRDIQNSWSDKRIDLEFRDITDPI